MEFVLVHVVAMTAIIGTNLVEKLAGAVERCRTTQHPIDEPTGAHNGNAFLIGHDRSRLIAGNVEVADDSDDQTIAQCPGAPEKLDMAVVEKVADDVGVDPHRSNH
jgi:hypothetical protein